MGTSIWNVDLIVLCEAEHVVSHADVLAARPKSNAHASTANSIAVVVFDDVSESVVIPVARIGACRLLNLNRFRGVVCAEWLAQSHGHVRMLLDADFECEEGSRNHMILVWVAGGEILSVLNQFVEYNFCFVHRARGRVIR